MSCLGKRVLYQPEHGTSLPFLIGVWDQHLQCSHQHDKLRVPLSSELTVRIEFEPKRKFCFAFALLTVPRASEEAASFERTEMCGPFWLEADA